MCTASLLAHGALYPHPATAHSLAPGMAAPLRALLGAAAANTPKGHTQDTSYRLHYTRRPPRSLVSQAAAQTCAAPRLARELARTAP